MKRFGLDAQQTGYILAYIGIVLVIMKGGLTGPRSQRFKESDLLVTFILFIWVRLPGWAVAAAGPFLLAGMPLQAIGAGSFNALISSIISKPVDQEEVGGLESFTRVVMPALASYLLRAYGQPVPGRMASSLMLFTVFYLFQAH